MNLGITFQCEHQQMCKWAVNSNASQIRQSHRRFALESFQPNQPTNAFDNIRPNVEMFSFGVIINIFLMHCAATTCACNIIEAIRKGSVPCLSNLLRNIPINYIVLSCIVYMVKIRMNQHLNPGYSDFKFVCNDRKRWLTHPYCSVASTLIVHIAHTRQFIRSLNVTG